MPYAQRNYSDTQGIGGIYTIGQIGCFLTSICNVLDRNGRGISPPELNRLLIAANAYVDVDDGIRDDLGWETIQRIFPDIGVFVNKPNQAVPSNDVIVRMDAGNVFGTHFCFVDHVENGQVFVIDSLDARVKSSNQYGPITGWARYEIPHPPVDIPAVTQQGEDMIVDEDNYFARYSKTFYMIRGRTPTRIEFQQFAVGKNWLQALEMLEDDPEADSTAKAQDVGWVALTENWPSQIQNLTESQRKLQGLNDQLTKAVSDAMATDSDNKIAISTALGRIDSLTKEIEELHKQPSSIPVTEPPVGITPVPKESFLKKLIRLFFGLFNQK